MDLKNTTLFSLVAIASLSPILPATAVNISEKVAQIPIQIREINSNLPPTTDLNSPINPTFNNSQIKIFDPLNPTQPVIQTNVLEQPISRKPLTGKIIPVASAIVVSVPSDLQFDAGGGSSITLMLVRAIYDTNGEEVIPVNSLVSARLQPDGGGVKIVADSLILRGIHLRLRASTAMVRGETTTTISGISKSDSFGNIGEILLRPFGEVSLVGRGIGTIVGLLSPERQTTVRIPQGTIFVLSLESAIVLQ